MIETEITISINRKTDLEVVRQQIVNSKLLSPVYILEYENHYQISFVSNYEEWELDTKIGSCFSEYEFTTDIHKGRNDIRLEIHRCQSQYSTDGWGRPIENPLDETKYLIKRSNKKPENFNPHVKVLFGEDEQEYYINIINGINRATGQKGFLLLNQFKTLSGSNESEIFKDQLYQFPVEAFHSGYYKLQEIVNKDFKAYVEERDRKLKEQQKVPRKIIREFINSCNKSETEEIIKNLDDCLIFERRIDWQTITKTKGIQQFKEYLKSPNQKLCGKNFKIRSYWNFTFPSITIGLKYFPISTDNKKEIPGIQQYRELRFVLDNHKIISISVE